MRRLLIGPALALAALALPATAYASQPPEEDDDDEVVLEDEDEMTGEAAPAADAAAEPADMSFLDPTSDTPDGALLPGCGEFPQSIRKGTRPWSISA